jgi:hypothetical protein
MTITGTGSAAGPAVVVEDVPNPEQISIIDTSISGYPIGIVATGPGSIVQRNVTVNLT